MMVKQDDADGMVAGAINASADVLRAALQTLKTAPGTRIVSAFFLVVVPDCEYGANGAFVFSDAGLNQSPSASELADIAEQSAKSFQLLVQEEPVVAMLSHSTKGSAKHPDVDKVIEATEIVNAEFPDLLCDGELQSDAALVPEVASSKAPGSYRGFGDAPYRSAQWRNQGETGLSHRLHRSSGLHHLPNLQLGSSSIGLRIGRREWTGTFLQGDTLQFLRILHHPLYVWHRDLGLRLQGDEQV